jgi:lipopolysaccharide transport system permease protein
MRDSFLKDINRGRKIFSVSEMFRFKDLLYFMVWRDITVLYKQTILGVAWAILNPLFQVAIFSIVFGYLAGIKPDVQGLPYVFFSALTVIPWTYFSNSISSSANSLVTNSALMSKVYFPRLFLPLTPILSKMLDFSISLLIVLGMMVFYQIAPGWQLFLLPIPILLLVCSALGMGSLLSCLVLQYRDVRFAIQFMMPFLMYLAPVAFPATLVQEKLGNIIFHLYALYPMVGAIESFKACFIPNQVFPWTLAGISAAGAVFWLVIGVYRFKKVENYLADIA